MPQSDTFAALADPTRRRIIDRLRQGPQPVNELIAAAGVHQSGVSRHLRILRVAGFVTMTPVGQQRIYTLKPEPFQQLDEWLDRYRALWEKRLDRFGAALEARTRTPSPTRKAGPRG